MQRSSGDPAASGAVVVVHLRLGDALDPAMTTAINGVEYVHKSQEYRRMAYTLAKAGHKRAVLVGSIHLSDKEISRALYEKNARYVDEVEASFATSGLRVERLHGSSPDVDLKLFHVAKYFVPARSSGFSNIAVQGRAYQGLNLMQAA